MKDRLTITLSLDLFLRRLYLLLAGFGMLNWVFQMRSMNENPNAVIQLLLTIFLTLAVVFVALVPRPPSMRRMTPLLFGAGLLVTGIFFALFLLAFPKPLTDVSGSVNTAADLLSQGLNPYVSFDALESLRRNGLDPAKFGTYLSDGTLQSKYNYPPLSFLLLVPVHFAIQDIRVINWLLLAGLVIFAATRIDTQYRPLAVLPLLLVPGFMLLSAGGITEPALLLPLFLAWTQRGSRRQGGFWLGVACLIKQNAWYYFPFYIVLAWKERGIRHALVQAAISGGIFLLVSLPFAWGNWSNYVGSLLAPLVEPLPAAGEGLGGLIATGVLALPRWLPALLQLVIAAACFVALIRSKHHALLLSVALPVLPLLVAWRSLLSYFLFGGYLVLLIYLAHMRQTTCEQVDN